MRLINGNNHNSNKTALVGRLDAAKVASSIQHHNNAGSKPSACPDALCRLELDGFRAPDGASVDGQPDSDGQSSGTLRNGLGSLSPSGGPFNHLLELRNEQAFQLDSQAGSSSTLTSSAGFNGPLEQHQLDSTSPSSATGNVIAVATAPPIQTSRKATLISANGTLRKSVSPSTPS